MTIREDSVLSHVVINVMSRTIDLYGDDGEHMQVTDSNGDEFTNMCNFVNKTLQSERIQYVY